MTRLDELRKRFAGDGAIWMTDALMRELLDAIIGDRARLSPSHGNELPSPDGRGRWFMVDGGGGVTFYGWNNGTLTQYSVAATAVATLGELVDP